MRLFAPLHSAFPACCSLQAPSSLVSALLPFSGLCSFSGLGLTRLCVASGNDAVKARGWLLQAGLIDGDVVLSAKCHLTQEHVADVVVPTGHARNWGAAGRLSLGCSALWSDPLGPSLLHC